MCPGLQFTREQTWTAHRARMIRSEHNMSGEHSPGSEASEAAYLVGAASTSAANQAPLT